MLRTFILFCFALLAAPAFAAVQVNEVRLGLQEGGATRFVMELNSKVKPDVFLLNNPPRVVLDFPTLTMRQELQPVSKGLVKGWRSGQFGNGTRVVLDLTGPAKTSRVDILPPGDGRSARFLVDLLPVAAAEFSGLARKAQNTAPKTAGLKLVRVFIPPPLPERKQPLDVRPLIVIDAGHGGVDPGALASAGQREKDLTLAMARRLATQLESSGNYKVKLTRNRDVFISLPQRVKISRGIGADLFISLHADSIRGREVRGATVYTLSDKASDREAAALAESENRSDALAGLEQVEDNDTAASILIAMSHRAALNDGRSFAAQLVKSFRSSGIRMTENPQRSAGFAVLKAPDVPSVLIEMGYLSSAQEAQKLFQAEHQQKLVQAIEAAANRHFGIMSAPALAAAR